MYLFYVLGNAVNNYMVLIYVSCRSFNDAVSIAAAILRRMISVKLKGLERK
jgi:hypothetical protein